MKLLLSLFKAGGNILLKNICRLYRMKMNEEHFQWDNGIMLNKRDIGKLYVDG